MEIKYPTSAGDYGEVENLAKAGALDALAGLYPDPDSMSTEDLKEYSTWQGAIEEANADIFDMSPYMPEERKENLGSSELDDLTIKSAEEVAQENALKALCPNTDCPEFTLTSIRMAVADDYYNPNITMQEDEDPCVNPQGPLDNAECMAVRTAEDIVSAVKGLTNAVFGGP